MELQKVCALSTFRSQAFPQQKLYDNVPLEEKLEAWHVIKGLFSDINLPACLDNEQQLAGDIDLTVDTLTSAGREAHFAADNYSTCDNLKTAQDDSLKNEDSMKKETLNDSDKLSRETVESASKTDEINVKELVPLENDAETSTLKEDIEAALFTNSPNNSEEKYCKLSKSMQDGCNKSAKSTTRKKSLKECRSNENSGKYGRTAKCRKVRKRNMSSCIQEKCSNTSIESVSPKDTDLVETMNEVLQDSSSNDSSESNKESGMPKNARCGKGAKETQGPKKQLTCRLCQLVFTQQAHLRRHLTGHEQNDCKLCPAQFTKRKALCKHMKAVHNISQPEKLYKCHLCDRKFFKSPSLYAHLKEHAGKRIVCIKCGHFSLDEDAHKQHMESHFKAAKYYCAKCDEYFLRTVQYDQHMLGHARHICDLCNTSFPTKKLLLKHRSIVHGISVQEKKQHKCNICHKVFQRPALLKCHLFIHRDEKPFKCADCEKSLRNMKSLNKHCKSLGHLKCISMKEGKPIEVEKPFLCSQCGATFYKLQGLRRHIQQIHTDSKSFECPYCDYKCNTKTNLKRHIELHTDSKRYICEQCGAAFHALTTLKEHNLYVHSDARNHVCNTCGKGFKVRSGLRRHMRIHSNLRPYECFSCGQSYKRMFHLRRHMVSIHKIHMKTRKIKRLDEGPKGDANDKVDSQVLESLSINISNDPKDNDCDNAQVILNTSISSGSVVLTNSEDYILVTSYSEKDSQTDSSLKDQTSVFEPVLSLVANQDLLCASNDIQVSNPSDLCLDLQTAYIALNSGVAHISALSNQSEDSGGSQVAMKLLSSVSENSSIDTRSVLKSLLGNQGELSSEAPVTLDGLEQIESNSRSLHNQTISSANVQTSVTSGSTWSATPLQIATLHAETSVVPSTSTLVISVSPSAESQIQPTSFASVHSQGYQPADPPMMIEQVSVTEEHLKALAIRTPALCSDDTSHFLNM